MKRHKTDEQRTNAPRRVFLQRAGALAAAATAAPTAQAQTVAAVAAVDRGLWISWYDVATEARPDYLNWVHTMYLPALLKRPGYVWAAHYQTVERMQTIRRENATEHPAVANVPRGRQFLLLVGAADANVFGRPTPHELHAALSESDRKMLALRVNQRINVMAEVGRVNGPEAKGYADGVKGTPCIQLGSFNCAVEDEEEMLAWYAQSRMPAMAVLPGCVRTRKLASVAGWAKHAIFYEYASLEARNKSYLTLEDGKPEMKAWSDRMVAKLIHAPGSANLATRIWPAV